MGVFRIYSEKSNTIASGVYSNNNAGQNAVFDLFYGGGDFSPRQNSISRGLLYFDLTELQGKLSSGEIVSSNISSFKLKIKNTIPQDAILENNIFSNLSNNIASSFDLQIFPINQFWDQGIGYDLIGQNYLAKTFGDPSITGFSNWNYATSTSAWTESGVFTNPVTAVTYSLPTQHFDLGSEDINVDITPIVNGWLYSGVTNYGVGISYTLDFESTSGNNRYISSFLTQKTNSAFKPYIEVNYEQVIKDDRNQVSNNRTSRLFLYTFSGNTNANFYSASTVFIKNAAGTPIITGLTPTQFSKGAYYVDVLMTGATRGQKYFDVWSGITFVPGVDVQDYVQNFIITDNYYTSSSPSVNNYTLNVYGLENNQIVTNNDIYRVFVVVRTNYSQRQPSPNYILEYRLVMNNQDEIIPWDSVNSIIKNNCQEQYFDLDGTWLLENQTYRIEFRINELGSKRVLPENIYFKVLKPF